MKLVVLCALLGLFISQAVCFHFSMPDLSSDPDEKIDDEKKHHHHHHGEHEPCCVPEQWEGKKMIILPSRDYLNEAKYSYDAKEQRDHACGWVIHQGQTIKFEMLRLFKKKQQYITVEREGDKKGRKCTAAPLQYDWKEMCIPKDAKFLGTHTVGGKLEVNSWNFTMTHPSKLMAPLDHEFFAGTTLGVNALNDIVIELCVTKKCIPTGGMVFPANGEGGPMDKKKDEGPHRWPNVPQAGLFHFIDVTKGIKDDKVFEVPKGCGN